MRASILTALLILLICGPATAQEENASDLSRYEIFEEGEAIKTLKDLEVMEDAYKKRVAEENCSAAIPAIIEFYEAANHVSNIIRRGNEPYYDASRDDQEAIANRTSLLSELISAERTFNNLIRQRNRAWVEEAKCLLTQGKKQEAVTRLYHALGYIDGGHEERELWKEARTLLWAEVDFSAEN